MRADL